MIQYLVAFVAATAKIFCIWQVDPVTEGSETPEMVRMRVMGMVVNDTGRVLLLQLLDPERAALAWKRR